MGPLGTRQCTSTPSKTELSITADQEAAWAAYTKVMTDTATSMRAAVEGASTADRQALFATMQEQMQTSFDAAKVTAEQLLVSLNETQKAKAEQILPGLASGPMAILAKRALIDRLRPEDRVADPVYLLTAMTRAKSKSFAQAVLVAT